MITIEQCRAARGLVSWTQQDLAEASGLSKTAINNFEKGHSDIKADSLRAIRLAFESADVEFLDTNGLRKRSENVEIFRGEYAFEELLDDIFETLSSQGGEVLISNSSGSLHAQATPQKIEQHTKRMEAHLITERIISFSNLQNDWGEHQSCRSLPHDSFSTHMCSFIYGGKVAFMLWDSSMIILVNSTEASNLERRRFEFLWNTAQESSKQQGSTEKSMTQQING